MYAFYGEIFSTLSHLVTPNKTSSPEPILTDTLYFSYPQCRLIRKHGTADLSGRPMYTIPDFAFIRAKIEHTANGGTVMEESVAFLTEIKRLHDESTCEFTPKTQTTSTADFHFVAQPLPFIVSTETDIAFSAIFDKNIRQLLLQAFCAWHVYNQPHINLNFICGIYFALIKFTRPPSLHPLPTLPASTGEKRKHNDLINTISSVEDVQDFYLSQWVPRDSIEVVYWREAVTDNPRSQEFHFSVPFRRSLKLCLEGADSQPSGLFDVIEAEVCSSYKSHPSKHNTFAQLEGTPVSGADFGTEIISSWYLDAERPRTPARTSSPPEGSASLEDTSSPYKDRVVTVDPFHMELRSGVAQKLESLKW